MRTETIAMAEADCPRWVKWGQSDPRPPLATGLSLYDTSDGDHTGTESRLHDPLETVERRSGIEFAMMIMTREQRRVPGVRRRRIDSASDDVRPQEHHATQYHGRRGGRGAPVEHTHDYYVSMSK